MIDNNVFADGGCPCGSVTYTLLVAPMFVHCCHCTWCQRETGSAFAINALIESRQIDLHDGQLESVDMPTSTGHVQQIVRATCGDKIGHGVLEQMHIGPSSRLGFDDWFDGAK